MAEREVYVVGGANSAGQAALHLAEYANRVTLVIRAESLDIGMSHYLARQVEGTANLDVRLGTEVVGGGGEDWLDHLVLRRKDNGATETVAADALFLMIGSHPNTDWLPAEIVRRTPGSFSRDRTSRRMRTGHSSAARSYSRAACPVSSPWVMSGTGR